MRILCLLSRKLYLEANANITQMGKQRFRRSRFDQPTKNGDKIRGEPRRIVSWFYPTMNTSIESSKRKKKTLLQGFHILLAHLRFYSSGQPRAVTCRGMYRVVENMCQIFEPFGNQMDRFHILFISLRKCTINVQFLRNKRLTSIGSFVARR